MAPLRTLLIQVRSPSDPMADHEEQCIRRRIGDRTVALQRRNALETLAKAAWLDGADAVILGGSGDYSVHDPRSRPWVEALRAVIEAVLERDLPAFGICFGHQLLGHHLGISVATDDDRAELGTVEVQLTEEGRRDPLFSLLDHVFPVHTGHSDHVVGIPQGVTLLASNERLHTQAFRVNGSHFYTTQFHPDMTGAEALSRYLAYQESLASAVPETSEEGADHFRPGEDVTAGLLGRFIDLIMG